MQKRVLNILLGSEYWGIGIITTSSLWVVANSMDFFQGYESIGGSSEVTSSSFFKIF
ncbi:24167_t:CDS:2 [Gigaspora margarita]|uniref:24167_t:CDS:1 n=1 Tax=Gigaspora margarita TaxID=4874 RepID=A0ABM8W0X7_GIGMA|nr:24167_t:CDS:2 [Gigaspora margarita]